MRIDILTIFPEALKPFLTTSILKRAQDKKKLKVLLYDLRDYSDDKKHRSVDDRPFGGGPGMVMRPQPIFDAIKKIKGRRRAKVVLMCPTGKRLTQGLVRTLAREKNLIFVCGHYEGVDERVRTQAVDASISIGDYILTGGELPALVVLDAVTRLIPGVLGKSESLREESFENGLLEYPQYTRPANFRGKQVPNVLLSGHHKRIAQWRKTQALALTKKLRPDLLTS